MEARLKTGLIVYYNSLFSVGYLRQVTDSSLTITSLCPRAVVIAKSVDSYLATLIARLI